MRRRLGLGLLLLGLWGHPALAQAPATPPLAPRQGIWLTNIDSNVLYDPAALPTALTELSQDGFTTLYPTVWNGGYTLWPSAIATQRLGQSQDPKLQNRDLLAELIPVARRQGQQVVAWFEFGLMAPADAPWLRRRSDWLLQDRRGNVIWLDGQERRVWLNPLHPGVQQLIGDLLVELARRYDLDGIQLDDHFGYPVLFGYDPLTLARWRTDTGAATDAPPPLAIDPAWIRWRADRITQWLGQLRRQLAAVRPGLRLSVSPNPQGFSYNQFLADWRTWVEQGLVDDLVLQVYRRDLDSFQRELQQPELLQARQRIPVSIGLLAGLRNQPMPNPLLSSQWQLAQQQGYSGVSLFFYESWRERRAEGLTVPTLPSATPDGVQQQPPEALRSRTTVDQGGARQ